MRICHDKRTHACQSLMFKDTGQFFEGSSLLVMNDAIFSEKDWKSIQSIGKSEKRKSWGKTGRFGVGFNSVCEPPPDPTFQALASRA